MVKITVVTVCLNVEDSIEETMLSVVNQTYANVEYIIQDGGSTDNTLHIVEEYKKKYNINLYSEKDTGLYNAMNRAVKHATGDYILFLNSKDVFCSEHVLEDIVANMNADLVMGNVIRVKEQGEVVEKYGDRRKVFLMLLSGRMPCHQIIFAKRELLVELGFQERFSICADFDFMVRCCKKKCSMKWVNINVSKVDCIMGISSQEDNLWKMRQQDDLSLKENYYILYEIMRPIKYLKRIIDNRK